MPVFINEVITEVPQSTSNREEVRAPESATPVSSPEYDLLDMLKLNEERQQRLKFD